MQHYAHYDCRSSLDANQLVLILLHPFFFDTMHCDSIHYDYVKNEKIDSCSLRLSGKETLKLLHQSFVTRSRTAIPFTFGLFQLALLAFAVVMGGIASASGSGLAPKISLVLCNSTVLKILLDLSHIIASFEASEQ